MVPKELSDSLAELGRDFYARGWALGTSGNFSAVTRREPLHVLVTASGADKGKLTSEQMLLVDEGENVIEGTGRPSAIEVEAGDLLRVPRGTWHWFDLCTERQIRCIRLFQDPSGWTPNYTESGVDRDFEPVCLGRSFKPAGSP